MRSEHNTRYLIDDAANLDVIHLDVNMTLKRQTLPNKLYSSFGYQNTVIDMIYVMTRVGQLSVTSTF